MHMNAAASGWVRVWGDWEEGDTLRLSTWVERAKAVVKDYRAGVVCGHVSGSHLPTNLYLDFISRELSIKCFPVGKTNLWLSLKNKAAFPFGGFMCLFKDLTCSPVRRLKSLDTATHCTSSSPSEHHLQCISYFKYHSDHILSWFNTLFFLVLLGLAASSTFHPAFVSSFPSPVRRPPSSLSLLNLVIRSFFVNAT